MDKKNFAFDKVNFILLAVGMCVVILGFILMSGGGSTETTFDENIFSPLRIKVAPVVCFVGFISIIYGFHSNYYHCHRRRADIIPSCLVNRAHDYHAKSLRCA